MPADENGKYEYQEVVELDGNPTKEEIYGSAMIVLAKVFVSSKDVIQSHDQYLGLITGNFSENYKYSFGYTSEFTFGFRLDFKDGKYRVTVNYRGHRTYGTTYSAIVQMTY